MTDGSAPRHAAGVSPRARLWLDGTSYALAGFGLFMVLWLHLLPGLLAGLLVYQLVHTLAPLLARRLSGHRARLIALALLSALIVGVLTAITLLAIAHFKADAAHTTRLFDKMMEIVDQARDHLPAWADQYLPDDIDDMRDTLSTWLHAHMGTLQLAGREAARAFAHILIGMVLGAIVAVDASDPAYRRPLAAALITRVSRVADAFRRIVFAQVKISLVNTVFTAIFLLVALPLLDVKLPLAKTLVALTFVVGLLPVIGNLISNSLIIIAALSVGLPVTIAALVFLVLIHKLEYFLNARIVGGEIEAKAWELLLAMLLMEAAFGLPGVVAAPIYYAYMKRELRMRGLV
ncbi:AI-2E family transporter [Chitinasiproducens palmae]|uniref:Predicted PurR-regulated permease PerM n=1 Tax=Chitinasiproducens palmae TaxID=1770053 RepID=A0A1H2PNF0_9BURK|nr:AI-2E family transporter [Chitinasiproducens palmae]SDV48195.1 Predicted PurR-regulated permease PerM [Chitinasiproducens palmae]